MHISLRHWAAGMTALAALGLSALVRGASHDRLAALAAGAVVAAAFWIALGRLRQPLLSPALLYLGVFGLFHLGLAAPWALGLYERPLPWWFQTNRLAPALALVVLAVGFYVAGLLWAGPAPAAPRGAPRYTNLLLFQAGTALFLAGGVMFLLGIRSFGGARFFDAGYAETYRLAAQFDPRLFGTSFTVTPIGLYLAAAAASRRQLPAVVLMTGVWVAGIFYLGFRGYALIPGLVVVALLGARGFRMPGWAGAVLVAAVLMAIPAARAVRDAGVRQRSLDRAAMPERVHPLEGVAEMGGSLRPLVHTLTYLETESWRWGRTYWQSLQTVAPNLARSWQGGPYIPLERLPPNHWLTAQAEPGMYRQYGGLGFSAVAEPYMNFGAAGVAGYFLALGALLGRAAGFASGRPSSLARWAVVLGPLLWTTRNSFEIFFRPAVWGLAVVGLVLWCGPLLSPRLCYAPASRQ
jgi:hypothetical protein